MSMMRTMPAPNPQSAIRTPGLKARVMWGFGGAADNLIASTPAVLGMLIYVAHFKMDPLLAGVAMFMPRLVDIFFDTLVGHLSDNTRSRWGRRRPFIVVGAVLCAALLPLLWMPPGAATAREPWMRNLPFLYFSAMQILYAMAYGLFVVPYTALGYELADDYDDRTRVLAWRMYIGLCAGLAAPWLYRLSVLKIFPNEAAGASWVSAGLGAVIIAAALLPVIFCRERVTSRPASSLRLGEAIRYTFSNAPFMIVTAGATIVLVGIFSANCLVNFINIFYVCRASADPKALAGSITGAAGTLGVLASYLSLFLIGGVSRRWSKRAGMIGGLAFVLAGALLTWFTLDPRHPWWQLATVVVSSLGMQGCWLMIASMVGDICDEDEGRTGRRREGLFSAVNSLSQKVALALAPLLGGWLLKHAGFDPSSAVDTLAAPLATVWRMKALAVGLPVAATVLAMAIFWFYPISRQRADETRRLLVARRGARRNALGDERAVCVN